MSIFNKRIKTQFMRMREFGIGKICMFNLEWIQLAESKQFFNVLPVSYEELMLGDTVAKIKEVTEFLGLDCTIEQIEDAIEFSKFDNMKKIEAGDPNAGENLLSNYKGNFGKGSGRVRSGKVKGYLDILSEEDLKYIQKVKDELGYNF